MEIVLLTITVISLVVAFVMSAAAWRVSRDERARSAARVAALAAAALENNDGAASPHDRPAQEVPERKIWSAEPTTDWETVAVNETRPMAPWAPARVSSFPSEAQQNRPAARSVTPIVDDLPLTPTSGSFLGSAVANPSSSGRQRGLAIAACVLFVALVGGGYWTIYGDAPGGVAAADISATTAPLELISMRHERQGSRLSITGLVRNPGGGVAFERLAAVVFLFDSQGAFITSARADVDFIRLSPGDESPFVVTVDAPSNVARYRVSFRNELGVAPHVDRRGAEPIAKELP